MASLDGVPINLGDVVWMEGKRGKVIETFPTSFKADFGMGFLLLIKNSGITEQNIFGGRSVYWEPPLPVFPVEVVGQLQKDVHAVIENYINVLRGCGGKLPPCTTTNTP